MSAAEANLRALFEAQESLSPEQCRDLRNHLLGGLAARVDADTWAELLAAAVADAER